MNNNDVLRRIRYTFDFSDAKMIALFDVADFVVDRAIISNWMKAEEDPEYVEMDDTDLAIFLNGLIIDKRGKREGPPPEPEEELTNNIILRKLKIALNLKSDDIIGLYKLINKKISPHELSAFLRNPKQKQYRICNDQYMRQFLSGLQQKHRGSNSENREQNKSNE